MSKREKITQAIKASHFPNFDEIAKAHETSRSFVLSIYKEIKEEILDAPKFWNPEDEIEDYYDLEDCPNCGSESVGYDGTGSVPFLECFQCDHNWIP